LLDSLLQESNRLKMFTNSDYVVSVGGVADVDVHSSAPELKRRAKMQNVVPMQIQEAVQHSQEDGPLVLYGQEVGMVKIIGQVINIEESATRMSYLVRDRTASIHAVKFPEREDEVVRVRRGDHVGVIGLLKAAQDEKSITVLRIWEIRDLMEVDNHLLELALLPLRVQRIHEKRIAIAQSQFNGESVLNHRGSGGGQTTKQQLNSRLMFSGSGGVQRGLLPPGGGDVGRGGGLGRFQEQAEGIPGVKAVHRVLRSCYAEMGMSLDELESSCGMSRDKLSPAINYLLQEGHIYCTMDDFHFKSTDV